VSATEIGGPLTVITDGGSLQLDGLAGPLSADTGGGPLIAQGITSATATVTTGGGNASLAFAAAPDMVTVSTDGGDAQLAVPGGPYALTADSDGGPQPSWVGIATDPQAHRSITVATDNAGRLTAPRAGTLGLLRPLRRRGRVTTIHDDPLTAPPPAALRHVVCHAWPFRGRAR
jgi:hypothetical protein